MARHGIAAQLKSMINRLKAERKKHADALEAVDAIFAGLGISTHFAAEEKKPRGRKAGKRGPGRPPGKTAAAPATRKAGRGRRGKFKISGNEMILTFVKAAGKKGVTGAEIDKHWKSQGRGAGVYVNISQLVKAKKLKRENIKGERGSKYTAL